MFRQDTTSLRCAPVAGAHPQARRSTMLRYPQHLKRSIGLSFGLILAFAPASHIRAQTSFESSPLSISGFGTLGAVRASNPQIEVLRDTSQPKAIDTHWSTRNDSALGVQAVYRFSDTVDAVIQGVSHYQQNGSFRPDLTWAFLKYDVTPRFSVRLGRVGIEFLMQADARLVGYSYLPIRPPTEFYGFIPINYGDGVDARLRWPVADGILRLEGFAGRAADNIPNYRFKGTSIFKGTLGYDIGAWQFRYINTLAKLAHNRDSMNALIDGLTQAGAANIARSIELQDKVSTYQSLGAAYDDGNWQLQAAVNAIRHQAAQMQNSQALTLLAGYRWGSLTPYLGYAQARNSQRALSSGLPGAAGTSLDNGLAQALQSSQIDSKTLSAGMRWDFSRNMDLKAQIDLIHAGSGSTLQVRNTNPNAGARTAVFSLSLDFIF